MNNPTFQVVTDTLSRLRWFISVACLTAIVAFAGSVASAAEPIKIGFGMSLSGGLAGGGKAALVAYQIWAEDVNSRGGLLGRPVQLIHYDDQSNPSQVPGIYAKLLDVDKVDLVVSGYATNQQAAAMPIIVQRNLLFFCMFGTAVNEPYKYPRYFQINPNGPDPKDAPSAGFFESAMTMSPAPKTVALVGADAEFSKNSLDGAHKRAEKYGLKIVYDRTYPPSTVDFSPVIRSIKATKPDLVFVASYPPDSVGMIRGAHELKLETSLFGGAMIGLQYAAIMQQLGPLLNGVVVYNTYVPEPTMKFPGVDAFLEKYQARAAQEGVDALGFFIPPFAYAEMQIIEQAITAVGSLDQAKLADYMHKTQFDTIIGKVKFGADGEWEKARIIYTQFQGIVGNDLAQFKQPGRQGILFPPEFKSGALQYPYSKIRNQ